MPDPLFDPDPSTDPDPDRVRVLRGAPKGMRDVRLRYRASGGLLGRRTVPRSRAESALLDYTDPEGFGQERVMTLAEAEEFLSGVRERAGAVDRAEAAKQSAVRLECPHCGVRRQYVGALSFLLGELAALGGVKTLSEDVVLQHAYRCPTCGSTEFFADGFLRHPIP